MTGRVFWQDSLDLIPVKQHKQGVMFIKHFSTNQISRHHVLLEKNINSYLYSSAQHKFLSHRQFTKKCPGTALVIIHCHCGKEQFGLQIFSPVFQLLAIPAVSVHYSHFAGHLLQHIFCNFLLLTFVSVVLSWYHTLTYILYADSWGKSD